MIKNIVFDFGGVIITIDQSQAIRRFEEIGLANAADCFDPYTQVGIFGDLEEGVLSAEEFREKLSEMTGKELTFDDCKYGWTGYCKELPQRNLQALLKLREQGYRLILLSNTNPFMMDWADSEEFDGEGNRLSHYFDAMYWSYKVKMMKPDEAIFRHMLKEEGINPEETLFVDDGQRNIATGEKVGMHTFCPKNGEDWTEEIYSYLR